MKFLQALSVSSAIFLSLACVSAARADGLSGSVSSASVNTTNLTFAASTTDHTLKDPNYLMPIGDSGAGTGLFSAFTGGAGTVLFDAKATTRITQATLNIGSIIAPATGNVQIMTITVGSNVLTLYLTTVTTDTPSSILRAGQLIGTGYVDVFNGSSYTLLDSPVIFEFDTARGLGNNPSTFSIEAILPEPSSLVLLGTGLLALAFVMRRRLGVATT
jgi:hypothetical protein